MYTQKQLAQVVIDACEFYNVEKVVISPGSRNAPLTIGFTTHSKLETLSVVDERCAAFFALGIAQQTQKSVALLCTSGSALLNYYPAVAEAFYSKIPLIVISADRPKHLIDIGDGQTIRQENVFKNHILYNANLVENQQKTAYNCKEVSKAICTAIAKNGPVHINVPFNEPLYEFQQQKHNVNCSFFQNILDDVTAETVAFEALKNQWSSSEKKLILVGTYYPNLELQQILAEIVENDSSVLVLTETTSNLHHPKFVNSIDQLITKFTEKDFQDFQPDLLITFGGFVVSKRIKQCLRNYKPTYHWHIDKYTKLDTYFSLTAHIKTSALEFFAQFKKCVVLVANHNLYQQQFLLEKQKRKEKHKQYSKTVKYSDFKVFDLVLNSIPDHTQLQISNSSPIRYTQLFDVKPTISVFCNRGTSGIDGSTSTAIGASFASTKQTVFITGDLSFFYDSNALWNSYVPNTFRIIIINNDGGGIFKIIPGPKSTEALPYFETKHGLSARQLADMFHYEYQSVTDLDTLNKSLEFFYEASKYPKILEIFTPSQINDVVLQDYFNFL